MVTFNLLIKRGYLSKREYFREEKEWFVRVWKRDKSELLSEENRKAYAVLESAGVRDPNRYKLACEYSLKDVTLHVNHAKWLKGTGSPKVRENLAGFIVRSITVPYEVSPEFLRYSERRKTILLENAKREGPGVEQDSPQVVAEKRELETHLEPLSTQEEQEFRNAAFAKASEVERRFLHGDSQPAKEVQHELLMRHLRSLREERAKKSA